MANARRATPIDHLPPDQQRTIQNRALLVAGLGCAALSGMALAKLRVAEAR